MTSLDELIAVVLTRDEVDTLMSWAAYGADLHDSHDEDELVARLRDRLALTGAPAIVAADKAARDAAAVLRATVARERSRGLSWAEVGRAFGMSRQAAHERFTRTPRRVVR